MLKPSLQRTCAAIAMTLATSFAAQAENTVEADSTLLNIFHNGDLVELNQLTYMESDWIIDIERVNDDNVDDWIDELYQLARSDSDHPIVIRILESPGGSTRDGLNFIDALHAIQNPVIALCTENAYSMGGTILYTLKNGLRLSTENCNIMTHEPHWSDLGKKSFSDLENLLDNGRRSRDEMVRLTSEASGLSLEDSLKLYTDKDLYLTPRQAFGGGLIDAIIPHRTENNFERNSVTYNTDAPLASLQITTNATAESFKNSFCDATELRQLDYCNAPKESQPSIVTNQTAEQEVAADTMTFE